MAAASRRERARAAFLSLLAALLWATYYLFVLGLSPTLPPSALLFYPFLFGGIGYVAWAILEGHGPHLWQLTRSGPAWGRIGLIAAMQLSILASTYAAGPVDTSLLSLAGDVILTPLLVMLLLGEGRERARSPSFIGGVLLSAAGASLTIVAGGEVRPLGGLALAVAPVVPLTVAVYFLSAARAGISTPTSAVVGHATLGGAFVSLLLSPLIPGGVSGLLIPSIPVLGLVALLGLTSFFFGPALYFNAIERAGIVLPALLMAAIPVFTLALSWSVLGIVPPLLGIVGVPIAVAGALLAVRGVHAPWKPTYRAGAPPTEPREAPGGETAPARESR